MFFATHIVRCQFSLIENWQSGVIFFPMLPSIFAPFPLSLSLRLLAPVRRFRWQNIIKMQIGSLFLLPQISLKSLWRFVGRIWQKRFRQWLYGKWWLRNRNALCWSCNFYSRNTLGVLRISQRKCRGTNHGLTWPFPMQHPVYGQSMWPLFKINWRLALLSFLLLLMPSHSTCTDVCSMH